MSFDQRDVRRSMDVYTLDNAYLGTVLRVLPGELAPAVEQVRPGALQSSQVNGEALGPMPTQALGNRGPVSQSAAGRYAVDSDGAQPVGSGGRLVLARWWGLRGRRVVAMDDVLAVSLERVVLRLRRDQL